MAGRVRVRFVPSFFTQTIRCSRGLILLAAAAVAACGGDNPSQPTPSPSPTPTPAVCPAPAGSGPRQTFTFSWTISAEKGKEGIRQPIPFPIDSRGSVEARTTTQRGYMFCSGVGPYGVSTGECIDTGVNDAVVDVCVDPRFVPGQWWFSFYCQGNAKCVTPLPAEGLSGTTTITYTRR